MATNPDTERAFKNATDSSEKISKAQAKIDKTVDTVLAKQVVEAIKQNDEVIINLKLQALKNAIHDIEANLENTVECAGSVEKVNADEDFSSEHQDEIQSICAVVAEARAKLTRQLEVAQKLEAAARKAVDVSADSKEAAEREFATLEGRINSEKKYLPELVDKAEKLDEKAQKAVDARDAKALAEARKGMEELGLRIAGLVMYHQTQDFENRLDAFVKKIQTKNVEDSLLAEFKDDVKRLTGISQESGKTLNRLEDLEKAMGGYAVGEYDVKKVFKELEIDSKMQGRVEPLLAKVLKGPAKDLEKGLDGLARQCKLGMTGKEMAAIIKKAGKSVYK